MDETSTDSDKVLFADLLDDLRRNGFSIGVDSYLRLQGVLARVSGRCTPDELKTLLCPLFATNKKQQEFFYNAFDSYFNLTQAEGFEDSPPPQRPDPEPKVEPVWARRWPYLVVGLLLTVVIAASSYYRERRVQINQSVNPQSSPVATPTPPPDLVTTVIAYLPVPEFIEPIRWLAFLIPLLIWLLYEWYLYNRRKLLLNKLSSDYQPHIFPFRPDTPPPAIFTSDRFYNLARRLRRRQIAGHDLLDITDTVNTTIKLLGYPVLRYKRASRLPEYLVLIERRSYRDVLGGFFDELVKAFERDGIRITRYYYEDDPRVCFRPAPAPARPPALGDEAGAAQGEQGRLLRDVINEHEGCRLLIFGSGEGLINPLTGAMEEWANLFDSLKERALLTYVPPSEWSYRELTLAEQFSIAPATFDGLHTLVDYYEIGEARNPQSWIHKGHVHPPPDFDSPDIIALLREHLGEHTFRWLCACAIYPSVQWDLTIYLGSLPCLRVDLADEQNLLRLIRLPWFRGGSIPRRWRRLLINELPPELYSEIRSAIVGILHEPEQAGLTAADAPHQLNIAIPRVFPVLSEDILSRIRLARHRGRIFRDYIFVRFLESKPKTRLNLALPRSLGRVFFPRGNTALRMRFGLRVLTLLIVSMALWLAAPLIVSAFKTEPTLTVEPMTTAALPSPSSTESPGITVSPTPGITPESRRTPAAPQTPEPGPPGPQLSPTPPTDIPGSGQPPLITPTVSPTAVVSPSALPIRTPIVLLPEESEPAPGESKRSALSLDTTPICPRVKVISSNLPVFTVKTNLSQSLRAEVTGGKVLQPQQYIWSLQYNGVPAGNALGSIVAGQGTSTVDILWRVDPDRPSKLVAKVIVTGYNVTCSTEDLWTIQTIEPDSNGGSGSGSGNCGCGSCGGLQCCPSSGYCVSCGECGNVCCGS